MERHQHTLSAGSSSSSAIDLTGTPSGIASSPTPSPALAASDSAGTFARRRASWARMDPADDPLRIDLADADPRTSTPQRPQPGWTMRDDPDPFFSPAEEDDSPPFAHADFSHNYRPDESSYSTAQPGPSSASLIDSVYRANDPDGHREDDEAALTRNMSRPGTRSSSSRASLDLDYDPERSATESHRTPSTGRSRRTLRYTEASPLRKTGNRLMTLSRNIRRVSLRVVNMTGMGIDEHVRLADASDEKLASEGEDEELESEDEALPDLSKTLPIRGRTLGFMGPHSRVRLAMYRFLVWRWTEPFILLTIIINAVVLTIQAARNVAPAADGDGTPLRVRGYFHGWEDYALFVLFVFFTCVSFALRFWVSSRDH